MKMKNSLRIAILAILVFMTQFSFAGSGIVDSGTATTTKRVYVNAAYWTGTITVHAQGSTSWAWGSITGTNNTWSLSCPVGGGPCTKTQTRTGQGYRYLTLSCDVVSADDNDSHARVVVTW